MITFAACHLPFGDCFSPAPHVALLGFAMTGMKARLFLRKGMKTLSCFGEGDPETEAATQQKDPHTSDPSPMIRLSVFSERQRYPSVPGLKI